MLIIDARQTKQFETIENCVIVKDPFTNDGDSFKIQLGGVKDKLLVVRLYGVDCMETNAKEDYMQIRLKEQGLYFGIHQKDGETNDYKLTLKLGKEATNLAMKHLRKPFTIKTKYTNAMGKQYRVYAYIQTAEGKDLGELLVDHGLARVYGRVDMLPESLLPMEYRNALLVKEIGAIRNRVGAWKWTDWRVFEQERAEYLKHISKLNVNQMEHTEFNIELISFRAGVSTTEAEHVLNELKNGPFKDGNDLAKRVKGVGKVKAEKLGKVLVFE